MDAAAYVNNSKKRYKKVFEIIDKSSIYEFANKPFPYSFQSPRRQKFSFPCDVISKLYNNPKSSKALLKIYQTCKYFFNKRQILLINSNYELKCYGDNVYSHHYNQMEFNLSKKVLFWIEGALECCKPSQNVMEKIYRCSLKELTLLTTNLSLENFKKLVSDSSIKIFYFRHSTIRDFNDANVCLDVIFKFLPSLNELYVENKEEIYSKETLENLNQLKFNNKFLYFSIHLFPIVKEFDAFNFCKFIQQYFTNSSHGLIIIQCDTAKLIEKNVKKYLKQICKSCNGKPFKLDTLTHVE